MERSGTRTLALLGGIDNEIDGVLSRSACRSSQRQAERCDAHRRAAIVLLFQSVGARIPPAT